MEELVSRQMSQEICDLVTISLSKREFNNLGKTNVQILIEFLKKFHLWLESDQFGKFCII